MRSSSLVALVFLACPALAGAADAAANTDALRKAAMSGFDQQIKPLLATYCVKCHGPEKQKAKLRLDRMTMADINSRAFLVRTVDFISITPFEN